MPYDPLTTWLSVQPRSVPRVVHGHDGRQSPAVTRRDWQQAHRADRRSHTMCALPGYSGGRWSPKADETVAASAGNNLPVRVNRHRPNRKVVASHHVQDLLVSDIPARCTVASWLLVIRRVPSLVKKTEVTELPWPDNAVMRRQDCASQICTTPLSQLIASSLPSRLKSSAWKSTEPWLP